MNLQRFFPLVAILLLIAGCTTTSRQTGAPVYIPGKPPPDRAVPESYEPPGALASVRVTPYQPPAALATTPAYSPAVSTLMQEADRLRDRGDLVGAVGVVEHALRIEPRNAHLWNRLAHLRMQQGNTGQASDLAAKSISLAGGDIPLKRDNWELIARARYAAGDIAGGRVAERKARMLR